MPIGCNDVLYPGEVVVPYKTYVFQPNTNGEYPCCGLPEHLFELIHSELSSHAKITRTKFKKIKEIMKDCELLRICVLIFNDYVVDYNSLIRSKHNLNLIEDMLLNKMNQYHSLVKNIEVNYINYNWQNYHMIP